MPTNDTSFVLCHPHEIVDRYLVGFRCLAGNFQCIAVKNVAELLIGDKQASDNV